MWVGVSEACECSCGRMYGYVGVGEAMGVCMGESVAWVWPWACVWVGVSVAMGVCMGGCG